MTADLAQAAAALADMHLAYIQSSSEHGVAPLPRPVGFGATA